MGFPSTGVPPRMLLSLDQADQDYIYASSLFVEDRLVSRAVLPLERDWARRTASSPCASDRSGASQSHSDQT